MRIATCNLHIGALLLAIAQAASFPAPAGAQIPKARATTAPAGVLSIQVGPKASPVEAIEIRSRSNDLPPRAATSASPAPTGPGIGKWMLALGAVLVLIFLCRWAAKRLMRFPGGNTAGQAITVLCRSTISPRQQLMLIQLGRRLVLVGNCGTQMNALCEINEPNEVSELLGQLKHPPSVVSLGFSSLFRRAGKQFDDPGEHQDRDPVDPELATTRDEISGLLGKVRLLAQQFKRA